eukprot:50120_1
MKVVFILAIATLLPLLIFAGNCECDECLNICRCGENNSSEDCKYCVSWCEPTNEDDCDNLKFWLFLIGNIISLCMFFGYCKWGRRNEEVKDEQSFWYKYAIKIMFVVLFPTGISGLIYWQICDCDDPWGCYEYYGELTCPSFGGDKCYWDGADCLNATCICCDVDITKDVVTAFSWVAGIEIGGGGLSIVWLFYKCFKDANKVSYDERDSY